MADGTQRKTLREYVEVSTSSAIGRFFYDEHRKPYKVLDCEAYLISFLLFSETVLELSMGYLDGKQEKKRFLCRKEMPLPLLDKPELSLQEVQRAKESALVKKTVVGGTGKAPIIA